MAFLEILGHCAKIKQFNIVAQITYFFKMIYTISNIKKFFTQKPRMNFYTSFFLDYVNSEKNYFIKIHFLLAAISVEI